MERCVCGLGRHERSVGGGRKLRERRDSDVTANCCELFVQEEGWPVGPGITCGLWSCPHQIVDHMSYFQRVQGVTSGFDAVNLGTTRGFCRYRLAVDCGSFEDPCIFGPVITFSCTDWIPDLTPPFGLCP